MIRAGIDWGSSSFRAYRFDEHINLIDEVTGPFGLKQMTSLCDDIFEQTLFSQIGHWLVPGDTILLSGMVTSRTGWQETPYMSCPADVSTIASHTVPMNIRGINLLFLPGIKQEEPTPDVMRGEELQLLGAAMDEGVCTVVLPGTHSKWARVNGNRLEGFQTLMTGEWFELVLKHSLVGDMASSDDFHQASFLTGVRTGFTSDTVLRDIFSLRAAVLLGQGSATTLHSQLSGLLIGHEIQEGLSLLPVANDQSIVLVGSVALCTLYQTAFQHLDIPVLSAGDGAAVAGFQQIVSTLTPN